MRPRSVKVGDIVQHQGPYAYGVVIGFVEHTHPKEAQQVIVMSEGECVKWTAQYCRVVSDNRANEP